MTMMMKRKEDRFGRQLLQDRLTTVSLFHCNRREQTTTRMWANAQRDGRPTERRWRPLFNAAKYG